MKTVFYVGIFCLISISISAQNDSQKAYEIAKKTQENMSGYKKYYAEMDMVLTKENGKSFQRKVKTYHLEQSNFSEKTINIFDEPADVKGTKMFSQPDEKNTVDDQWLFLPALSKTKRIANENKSGPFMGSELAFEDLGSNKLTKFTYQLGGTKMRNGRECLILLMFPVSKYSGYHHVETWIDKERMLPTYSRYFDKSNELVKVLEEELRDFGKFSLPSKMKVHNEKTGRETVIVWKNFNFNINIEEKFFNANAFETMN